MAENGELAAWNNTQAAEDFTVLPKGEYIALLESADNFNAKTGTAGVKMTFRVLEGPYAGRKVFHDCWLTEAAMKGTKRDLGKVGITDFAQLDGPTPQGMVFRVRVVLHESDDGEQTNRVRKIEPERIEPPTPDPFAPGWNGEHQDDAEHTAADKNEAGGDAQ